MLWSTRRDQLQSQLLENSRINFPLSEIEQDREESKLQKKKKKKKKKEHYRFITKMIPCEHE